MTKPRRGKPDSPSPGGASPEGLTMESLHHMMIEQFEKLESKVATKDCINNLLKTIEEQNKKISILEDKIAVMDSHISQLRNANDNLEQYQRRLCLPIDGIDLPPQGQKETGEDCLQKVQDVFAELGIEIHDNVIDRAHRVGKVKNYEGQRGRQMIVRLTTWRHRTKIYRSRKNTQKYKIRLDLTMRRREVLKEANKLLNSTTDSFAFADVNCNLCWFHRGSYKYFESLDDLKILMQ